MVGNECLHNRVAGADLSFVEVRGFTQVVESQHRVDLQELLDSLKGEDGQGELEYLAERADGLDLEVVLSEGE